MIHSLMQCTSCLVRSSTENMHMHINPSHGVKVIGWLTNDKEYD